jgi:hypothetical protein
MNQRFFRAEENAYELARATLDVAWGLPSHGQLTCIEPAVTAPRRADGQVYLATYDTFCDYEAAAELLPQLLASGAVEEITEAEYRAAVESPSPVS